MLAPITKDPGLNEHSDDALGWNLSYHKTPQRKVQSPDVSYSKSKNNWARQQSLNSLNVHEGGCNRSVPKSRKVGELLSSAA